MTRFDLAPAGGRLRMYTLDPHETIGPAAHPHGHEVAVLAGVLQLRDHRGTLHEFPAGRQTNIAPHEPHAWQAGPAGAVFWCYSWDPAPAPAGVEP